MDEPVPIDPERLLAQTAWVRRLARSLARDEASADDLVQETFVAALRRPPGGAENEGRLRAWFGFVLRNMAIRRARSELRREEREQRSLDGARSHTDERAEELEELRAELFRHVKALSEPARQVVLLHYFEELDSAQIARRLGVPDSTVRNRLRRALAELRERLAHEHGRDWRNLCLFVMPGTSAKVAVGGGAVAAAAGGLWIAGSALGLAALALVLWIAVHNASSPAAREDLAGLPIEIPRSTEDSELRAAGRTPHSFPAPDASRTPEAAALHVSVSATSEPPTTPYAHGIIVFGFVRDESGEPIDRVALAWADPWGRVGSATTEEGKYSANSFVPGLHVVRLTGDGCGPVLREITIAAEPELQQFDFTERRAHLVPIQVFDLEGDNLLDAKAGHEPLTDCCGSAILMHKPPGPTLESWVPDNAPYSYWTSSPHPDWTVMRTRWELGGSLPAGALGMLQFGAEPPYFVSLLHMGKVLSTQRLDVIPDGVTFRVERSKFDHPPVVESTRRTFVGVDGVMTEVLGPGVQPPVLPSGVSLRLQFLDGGARPVMARFKIAPEKRGGFGRGWEPIDSALTRFQTAHADGTRILEGLPPGTYDVCVIGTVDDEVPTLPHLGALPRRVEVKSIGENELLVVMGPARDVYLRSRCAADELFDWEIRTRDGLFVAHGKLVGHAPRSLRLPAGEFVIRLRATSSGPVLAEECFSMGEKPLVIELTR